jgi:hypothetical protein
LLTTTLEHRQHEGLFGGEIGVEPLQWHARLRAYRIHSNGLDAAGVEEMVGCGKHTVVIGCCLHVIA